MNMPFIIKSGVTSSWMETLGFAVFVLLAGAAAIVAILLMVRLVKFALTGTTRFWGEP